MSRHRCEICDALIQPMDFSFRLAQGLVCSSCVVNYGFKVAENMTADTPNPVPMEKLLSPALPPKETIMQELPLLDAAVHA